MPESSSCSPRRKRSGSSGPMRSTSPVSARAPATSGAEPVGCVILGAPSAIMLEVEYHGRAAHAGMFPEEGRSAIVAAARAIAEMRLGRIDDETTANIGTIEGGSAANVVPNRCRIVGEARSHDERKLAEQVQAMQDAITFAAGVAECEVETKLEKHYTAYRFTKDDLAVRIAAEALGQCGFDPTYAPSGCSRRERLQRARPAMREPRERDDRHPYAGRAHRGGRSRRHGRGHARAGRCREGVGRCSPKERV